MYNETIFNYKKSENQVTKWTPSHTVFDCELEYNGQVYEFTYQCNTNYSMPNKRDCVECLVSDAFAFYNSIDILDFANEFGYDIEDEQRVRDIYNACHDTYTMLKILYGEEWYNIIEEMEE